MNPVSAWLRCDRRILIFSGHYGSGKTNAAINCARALKRHYPRVALVDLDIVNPYFRTQDSAALLAREGIDLVVSQFANTNVDFPALPKEIYAFVTDPETRVVVDVGGDDRGALALGRYVPDIRAGGDYEMLAVLNASRPLTHTPEDAVGVLREIEAACGLPFTGLVNNTNLGQQTTAAAVMASLPYARRVAELMGVPVRFTCAERTIAAELWGRVDGLVGLDIQKLYYQELMKETKKGESRCS